MRIIRESSFDELIYYWLKSEGWKIPLNHPSLTVDFVLGDQMLNRERYNVLYSYRKPLLDTIPRDAHFHIIEVEEKDLPSLYIIPIYDWYLDSGKTFKLIDTAAHLKPNRDISIQRITLGKQSLTMIKWSRKKTILISITKTIETNISY